MTVFCRTLSRPASEIAEKAVRDGRDQLVIASIRGNSTPQPH